MKRLSEERLLALILAVSIGLLALSALGVLGSPFPRQADQPTGRIRVTTTHPSDVSASTPSAATSGDSSQKPAVTPSPTTADGQSRRGVLPIGPNTLDVAIDKPGALRVWPDASVLPVVHTFDRRAFVGRAANATPLKGITVILDPARGGADRGATLAGSTLTQKDVHLKVALALGAALRTLGATVLYTRSDDSDRSLFARVAFVGDQTLLRFEEEAKAQGYDVSPLAHLRPLMADIMRINQNEASSGGRGVFGSVGTPPDLRLLYDVERQFGDVLLLSIDTANASDPKTHGASVVIMSNDAVAAANNRYAAGQRAGDLPPNYSGYDSAARRRLADLLARHLATVKPGFIDAAAPVKEADLAVLRLTNVTSASITLGYVSNANDAAVVSHDDSVAAIVQAIASALYQYVCVA